MPRVAGEVADRTITRMAGVTALREAQPPQLHRDRRVLDRREAPGPGDVAATGTETEVADRLAAYAAAGATDLMAVVYRAGHNPAASIARTTELLQDLVGTV